MYNDSIILNPPEPGEDDAGYSIIFFNLHHDDAEKLIRTALKYGYVDMSEYEVAIYASKSCAFWY